MSKVTEFVVGLVVLAVIGAGLYLVIKEGWFGQEQVQLRPETKVVSWMPASQAQSGPGSTQEKTYIGIPKPYWIVPKKKRPDGGWDSIDGFWNAESPTRWDEKWQFSFCHDQVK